MEQFVRCVVQIHNVSKGARWFKSETGLNGLVQRQTLRPGHVDVGVCAEWRRQRFVSALQREGSACVQKTFDEKFSEVAATLRRSGCVLMSGTYRTFGCSVAM